MQFLVSDHINRAICYYGNSSLEYTPHFYGLFLHNNEMIPHNSSMWEYLDGQFPSGYQDTLVLHMMYKPVKVCYERDQNRYIACLMSITIMLPWYQYSTDNGGL